jgi:6-pyruvoyltetrahydropterin/6-carboxytetrahydropterin synthase
MAFVVELNKESFKFSGTHFTIFNASQAERLHGHNYYVSAQFELRSLQSQVGLAFDFNLVKPLIKKLCDEMDEHVLLPQLSPFLNMRTTTTACEVDFNQKRYIFPLEDVVMLPIVNVTVEELSRLLTLRLLKLLETTTTFPFQEMNWLALGVQETHGQRVVYRHECAGKIQGK